MFPNPGNFQQDAKKDCWGWCDNEGYVYIFNTKLNDIAFRINADKSKLVRALERSDSNWISARKRAPWMTRTMTAVHVLHSSYAVFDKNMDDAEGESICLSDFKDN